MQPWEFGSLPKAWLPALHDVDEVWAYSRSVRDCYLDAGVPADRVHVIPLGVDSEIFRPGLQPLALQPGPEFRFLFVGGTIFRKGIDVLLSAFPRAFQPNDGVGLVIKDMGTKSFYRGQTAGDEVVALPSVDIRLNTSTETWMRTKSPGFMLRVIAWFIRSAARGFACRSLRRWLADCR